MKRKYYENQKRQRELQRELMQQKNKSLSTIEIIKSNGYNKLKIKKNKLFKKLSNSNKDIVNNEIYISFINELINGLENDKEILLK